MWIFTREGVHRTKHFCGEWVWILSGTADYNSEKIFKNMILKKAVSQKNCYTFRWNELRKYSQTSRSLAATKTTENARKIKLPGKLKIFIKISCFSIKMRRFKVAMIQNTSNNNRNKWIYILWITDSYQNCELSEGSWIKQNKSTKIMFIKQLWWYI